MDVRICAFIQQQQQKANQQRQAEEPFYFIFSLCVASFFSPPLPFI
jgi:hypothetical protein